MTEQQVKMVLRRAAELSKTRAAEPDEVTVGEVEEIAAEVGIPAEAVRRALAEARGGLLPVTAPRPGVLDRAVGPHEVVVQRSVPGSPEAVRAHVRRFMDTQVMRVKRDLGERLVWERAGGLMQGARRLVGKMMGERLGFVQGMEVETSVVSDGDRAIVTFTLRAEPLRRTRVAWMTAGGVAGAILVFLGLANGGVITAPEAFSMLAGGGTAVGSYLGLRGKYRNEIAAAQLVVDRCLDGLEHGRPLPP